MEESVWAGNRATALRAIAIDDEPLALEHFRHLAASVPRLNLFTYICQATSRLGVVTKPS